MAEELVTGLQVAGFEPFLDRHDIAAAEDWEVRLGVRIKTADTIVFILSSAAVKPLRCKWEVHRAYDLGKRQIRVHGKSVAEADVPHRLRPLNSINLREGQVFARKLTEPAKALSGTSASPWCIDGWDSQKARRQWTLACGAAHLRRAGCYIKYPTVWCAPKRKLLF